MLDCIEISCASVGTVFSLEDFYLVTQKTPQTNVFYIGFVQNISHISNCQILLYI